MGGEDIQRRHGGKVGLYWEVCNSKTNQKAEPLSYSKDEWCSEIDTMVASSKVFGKRGVLSGITCCFHLLRTKEFLGHRTFGG